MGDFSILWIYLRIYPHIFHIKKYFMYNLNSC